MVGVHYGETPLDWRNAVLGKDVQKALALVPVVLAQAGVNGVRLVTLLGTSLTATAVARANVDRKVRAPAQRGDVGGVQARPTRWARPVGG
jgi:hypothetical protein